MKSESAPLFSFQLVLPHRTTLIYLLSCFFFFLASDLDCIRALFNEKEKELSLAVAKVEELTRQLEELRGRHNGNGGGQVPSAASAELEKLRRELMVIIAIFYVKNNKTNPLIT